MVSKTVLVLLVSCAAVAAANLVTGKERTWKTSNSPVRAGARPVPHHPSERIGGGQAAVPHSYPFMAYLKIGANGAAEEDFHCGATIISPEWVLTSASCMIGAKYVDVDAGSHFIYANEASRETIRSTDIIVHSYWDPHRYRNDISLIRMPHNFTFNEYIQAAKLPVDDIPVGTNVTVTGWGVWTQKDFTKSFQLMEVTTPTIALDDCADYYSFIITEDEDIVCTDGADNTGICHGDLGGPLSKDGVIYGISSFKTGYGCGSASYPNGFANVYNYLDWIKEKTGITPSTRQ